MKRKINITTKDYETIVFDVQNPAIRSKIIIPAGTRLMLVEGPQDMAFAVDDVPLLVRLTNNTHDPQYHYLFVPLSIVGQK